MSTIDMTDFIMNSEASLVQSLQIHNFWRTVPESVKNRESIPVHWNGEAFEGFKAFGNDPLDLEYALWVWVDESKVYWSDEKKDAHDFLCKLLQDSVQDKDKVDAFSTRAEILVLVEALNSFFFAGTLPLDMIEFDPSHHDLVSFGQTFINFRDGKQYPTIKFDTTLLEKPVTRQQRLSVIISTLIHELLHVYFMTFMIYDFKSFMASGVSNFHDEQWKSAKDALSGMLRLRLPLWDGGEFISASEPLYIPEGDEDQVPPVPTCQCHDASRYALSMRRQSTRERRPSKRARDNDEDEESSQRPPKRTRDSDVPAQAAEPAQAPAQQAPVQYTPIQPAPIQPTQTTQGPVILVSDQYVGPNGDPILYHADWEWKDGPLGFGLYDQQDQRRDPHFGGTKASRAPYGRNTCDKCRQNRRLCGASQRFGGDGICCLHCSRKRGDGSWPCTYNYPGRPLLAEQMGVLRSQAPPNLQQEPQQQQQLQQQVEPQQFVEPQQYVQPEQYIQPQQYLQPQQYTLGEAEQQPKQYTLGEVQQQPEEEQIQLLLQFIRGEDDQQQNLQPADPSLYDPLELYPVDQAAQQQYTDNQGQVVEPLEEPLDGTVHQEANYRFSVESTPALALPIRSFNEPSAAQHTAPPEHVMFSSPLPLRIATDSLPGIMGNDPQPYIPSDFSPVDIHTVFGPEPVHPHNSPLQSTDWRDQPSWSATPDNQPPSFYEQYGFEDDDLYN